MATSEDNASLMLILGRLEGKVDGFMATITRHEDQLKTIDMRLDGFDRDKSRVIGIVATVSTGVSLAGAWFAKKVGLV